MMDSKDYKFYHEFGFDSRQHLEHYISDSEGMVFEEDFLKFPIENLRKTFIGGHIKGDILIDLSVGSMIHHLYAACDFFKNVIVLKINDRCIMELKRWVDSRTGAFSWGHATKLHADIEGESEKLQEKEEKIKIAIQHVVKCDINKDNMMDPIILPPGDCIICAFLLEVVSKDKDGFIRNLKKFSGLLKPGGHLIFLGCLDATYYTIGKHKFHYVNFDENFVKKALVGDGFVIDRVEIFKRKAVSDLLDHKGVIFIEAHKEK
ncbi:indolethylamine N-methyltransferase-like [Dendrobates tinctorius]|uniref:indolethylamine N-methyltransferase-like n=1 Tax=Dendrobates tinctorius TaxID=92724 RepID=UPI003CC99399